MKSFYSRLSYSFGNEDWSTELKALQIQPTDRVLCITASGDRPLNLLTTDLQEIVAIDANPFQNALFDLKKVALQNLPYLSYLAFLGVDPSPIRLQTYSEIEHLLSPASSALWKRYPKKIASGVLYEGFIEKWLQRTAKILYLIRGKKIRKLFAMKDLKKQREFIKNKWDTFLWKKTFDFLLHPFVTRIFVKDPGLYENSGPNMHLGTYIYKKMHNHLNRYLASESVLLSLCFKGKVHKNYFPPYLSKSGVALIKERAHLARIETSNIISYLENAPDNSFDCFSISDVASYLSSTQFTTLMHCIHRTAKPRARFCIRQFLSSHAIPEQLIPHFKRDLPLEGTLEEEDRCFVYRFMVGSIVK